MLRLRRVVPVVVLFVVAVFAPNVAALTSPIAGAVALPDGVDMKLPFPAMARVRVLSGYSPTGGSSLHADTSECCKANDYYALDLNYADEASAGLGMPILAPLDGEVVRAGWASAGWANYGLRVILRHDLGDGHVYHTLYAHLNAIDDAVVEGATVERGQVIGELGRSCQGELSCGSFSTPHLHWAMHRDSMVGGTGTGGSYGGNAVVPEPFDGHEDLSAGDVLVSTNGAMEPPGELILVPGTIHLSPSIADVAPEVDGGRAVDADAATAPLDAGGEPLPEPEPEPDGGSRIDGGCSCRAAPRSSGVPAWTLVFVVVTVARLRRRASGR